MVYRLYTSHRTVDLEEIAEVETLQAEALEQADDPEVEEVPAEGPEEVELREDTR
jgi:hypothetical protein